MPDETEKPARKKRRLRGRAFCFLGLLASLAGFSGAWLSNLWIAFDLLSHFTLHFAIAAVAFLVGLMMPRFKALTAICLIIAGVMAIAAWPIAASRASVTLAPLEDEVSVKVMSFNSWVHTNNWRDVVKMIRATKPDIALILEFDRKKLPAYKALQAAYPHSKHCLGQRIGGSYCHLAILSKYPIVQFESQPTGRRPAYIRARFGRELNGLTVFGIHSLRPPYFRTQLRQMLAMNQYLNSFEKPKVVAGDFNATPFSRMLRSFAAQSGLTRITSLPTWPHLGPIMPQLAIDHIFISDGIRVLGGPVIADNAGSDHSPVIATLAIRK